LRPDAYERSNQPEIYVLTNRADVEHIAKDIVGVDPTIPDQRQRFMASLSQFDFTSQIAILAFSGHHDGCDTMTIQQIMRYGTTLILRANFVTRVSGQGCPRVSTDPAHLVAVAKDGTWHAPISVELWNTWGKVATTSAILP
jgi:hypothetical protein